MLPLKGMVDVGRDAGGGAEGGAGLTAEGIADAGRPDGGGGTAASLLTPLPVVTEVRKPKRAEGRIVPEIYARVCASARAARVCARVCTRRVCAGHVTPPARLSPPVRCLCAACAPLAHLCFRRLCYALCEKKKREDGRWRGLQPARALDDAPVVHL